MIENLDKISLLTAIVPIRPSLEDLENVFGWLESKDAESIHFVLVLDRPTPSILHLWAKFYANFNARPNAPKVDLVEGDFKGPGPARNAGFMYADSQYVAFWDSDDCPNIPRIVKYLLSIQLQQPKLVVGAFELIREGREKQFIQTNNLHQLARNPGLWRCLFPIELIKNNEFPDILLGEDQVFLANIISRSPQIEFREEVFYSYVYGNSGQLTSNKDFSDLVKAESLVSMIDVKNMNREEKDFIYNLSTKQLLTILLRGNLKIKTISVQRITRKLFSNIFIFAKSFKDMTSKSGKDRFNG